MYSADFVDKAVEMGYDCHDVELPKEIEVAVKNQMRRDKAQSSKMNKEEALEYARYSAEIPEYFSNTDLKNTADKPDPTLIPYEALVAYSKVSDHGLKVHGSRETWMNNAPKEGIEKYTAACARHLHKCRTEPVDPASGLLHIYSVLWNAAAAIWHYERLGK